MPKSVRGSVSVDGDSERCTGKWGLQAKRRVQSTEPKTKTLVQIQTNTATGEQSSFTSSCCGCGVAAGMAAVLSYCYPFLVTSQCFQCLETQCAQSFKEMKDHKNPSDVLMRTMRYKYINGADNRGRHSSTRR